MAIISSTKRDIVLDPVMVTDINDCYSMLRHMDGRTPDGDKYIVLDISEKEDLQKILQQVHISQFHTMARPK